MPRTGVELASGRNGVERAMVEALITLGLIGAGATTGVATWSRQVVAVDPSTVVELL